MSPELARILAAAAEAARFEYVLTVFQWGSCEWEWA